jgi:hypothetical protein
LWSRRSRVRVPSLTFFFVGTDLPTHLPGTIYFDRDRRQDTRVDLLPPAINTVRFEGSYLTLPVAAQPADGRGQAR